MCDHDHRRPVPHAANTAAEGTDAVYADLDQVSSDAAVELAASAAARRVAVGNVVGNPNAATLLADHGWEVRHRRGDSAADVELAALAAADLAGPAPPARVTVVSGDRDLTPLEQIAAAHGVHLTQRSAHTTNGEAHPCPDGDAASGCRRRQDEASGSSARGWQRQMRDIVAAQDRQAVSLADLGQLLRDAGVTRPNGNLAQIVRSHPELVLEGAHPHQRVRLARRATRTTGRDPRGSADGGPDASRRHGAAGGWQRQMRDIVAAQPGQDVYLTDLNARLRDAGVKRPGENLWKLVDAHPELILEGDYPRQRAILARRASAGADTAPHHSPADAAPDRRRSSGRSDGKLAGWQTVMRDVVAANNGESLPLTALGDALRSAGVQRPDGKLSQLVDAHPELTLEGEGAHQRARLRRPAPADDGGHSATGGGAPDRDGTADGWQRQMRDIVAQARRPVALPTLGHLLNNAGVQRPGKKLSTLVDEHPDLVLDGAHPNQRVRLVT